MTETGLDAPSPGSRAPLGSRWAGGVAAGMILAVPLGYLLSYLAFLPAMIGLFFFVLFGLLIGAAMFRVWAPLRPMPRNSVVLGVMATAILAWIGSLIWEGVTFPAQVAKEAIHQVYKEIPGKTADDIRADSAQAARQFLRERYPPGGVVGYWRWAVAGKHVEIPIAGVNKPRPIRVGGTGWFVVIRVLLSGVALTGAVWSMVKPLTAPLPPKEPEFERPAPNSHGNNGRGDY